MGNSRTLTVAVLGTGIMGEPMARNLLTAGFTVRAWNRTADKAQPLADDGAVVCASPREAAEEADFVLTMLSDADAVMSVVDSDDGPFEGQSAPIWLQMSTVGVDGNERLSAYAARHGITYVDAPVLGTRQPAEKGQLTILASGPDDVRERCQPVFDAVGRTTHWLGAAGNGTRFKLVMNSWVLALTTATAEAMALAEGFGIDPQRFLDTIEGGPLDVQYAHVKGEAMLKREFPASFPVDGAAKDARLIVEAAADAGVQMRVADAVAVQMEAAADAGHGREDMAAVWNVVSG
jgi:3-hydroxyisobutyrate dehydrogenase